MDRLLEYTSNHPFLAIAAVGMIILVLVNEMRLRAQGGAGLSPADAVRLINDGAVVLDVRNSEQYANAHILNAKNIPIGELPNEVGSLKKLKSKPVITCCDTGIASRKAASVLRGAGHEQVYNLRGGLATWQRENLPVVGAVKEKQT